MHTFQLTSFALTTLSTLVIAAPWNTQNSPGGPMVTASFNPSGTGGSPPFGTGISSFSPSFTGIFTQPSATAVPSAFFKIQDATNACHISVSNLPSCKTGGHIFMSNTTTCSAMDKKHYSKPKFLKGCKDVNGVGHELATIRLHNNAQNGTMAFEYEEGGLMGGRARGSGTGGVAVPTTTVVAGGGEKREVAVAHHCECEMGASKKECKAVKCFEVGLPFQVKPGKNGDMPDDA